MPKFELIVEFFKGLDARLSDHLINVVGVLLFPDWRELAKFEHTI